MGERVAIAPRFCHHDTAPRQCALSTIPSVTLRTPLAWLLLAGLASAASGVTAPRDEERFFETSVRPILVEHCFSCHSNAAPKVKGGLKLD